MNRIDQPSYREGAAAMPWREEACLPYTRAAGPSLAARAARELAAAWAACAAFEWIALGYLGVTSALILIFAENLTHPFLLIGTQALVAAVLLTLCRVEVRSAERAALRGKAWAHRFWHFWRHWYPHLFFLFCFEELAYLVHLVYPGWFEAKLIAFDYWLTGVHPVLWLERFANPLLNEFMQFAYITYFLYLLVLGGVLYVRRDWKAYWAVMAYSAAGYVLGYFISMFFPIQSPWHAMAGAWQGELKGGFFTELINLIERYGRVRGAAFPSEHVAGSVAALWGAWRHRRWLFWVFLPLVFFMCISTVYGRYHYVADVFAGMVTGTLGYWLGAKLMRVRGALPEQVPQAKESQTPALAYETSGERFC
jgi:membrane-associated phospholipid phosphatase